MSDNKQHKSFWDRLGVILADTAKVAAKTAIWVSQHPQVIGIIGSVAKLPPNDLQGIEAGAALTADVMSNIP